MEPPGRPTGTVTFVFTDIEGSTQAWDTHHGAMDDALVIHDQIVADAVGRQGGYIFSTGGDGVAAAFGSAGAGIAAALDLQRAIGATDWPAPLRLRVRIGINTGDAVERDGDYFGPAVIRAARLMSLVDGGRTLCSASTAALARPELGGGIELVPLGTVRLRGLRGDEEVYALRGPGLDEPGTPLTTPDRALRGAPAPLGRLLGRASELRRLTTAVADRPLVTITGMGGIGKTRLAQEVARATGDRFRDGVAWADVSTAADAASLWHEVAGALGVRAREGDEVASGVVEVVTGRDVLVVLDNCEHVRADAAEVAERVAGGAGHVLVTSRERLGLPHEHVVSLGPLDSNDAGAARALLLERLGDVETVDEQAIETILEHVDGIPLAIELAAARCRSIGATEVARRLGTRPRLLRDERRSSQRHRALDAVLDWTHGTLGDVERRTFRRLSVFAGAFPLDAAERVASDEQLSVDDVDDVMSTLVDRSLVLVTDGWFRLLEPVRQYAATFVEESGETDDLRVRHLRDVVARVREIHDGLATAAEARWVGELDRTWPDVRRAIRHALDTGDATATTILVTRLAHEAFFRRPEAFAWISEAVERFGHRDGPDRAALLGAGSCVAWTTLDVAHALALAEAALGAQDPDEPPFDALPQAGAFGALNFSGRAAEAVTLAVDLGVRHGATFDASRRVWLSASELLSRLMAGERGVGPRADAALRDAPHGASPSSIGLLWYAVGLARTFARDEEGSAVAFDRARTAAASVRNHWLLGMCANALLLTGDPHARLAMAIDAMDDALRSGWTTHGWAAGWSIVSVLTELAEPELAAEWLGACVTSGVERLGLRGALPPELEAALDGSGDAALVAAARRGRTEPFAELATRTIAALGL